MTTPSSSPIVASLVLVATAMIAAACNAPAHIAAKGNTSQSGATTASSAVGSSSPTEIVARWRSIGLTVEIPWRKSVDPSDEYVYISQCRGWVGTKGPAGFETEIECEVLGMDKSSVKRVSVGLELWNTRFARDGLKLAERAIDQIGITPPPSVLQAFRSSKSYRVPNWAVVIDHNGTMKQVMLEFTP